MFNTDFITNNLFQIMFQFQFFLMYVNAIKILDLLPTTKQNQFTIKL